MLGSIRKHPPDKTEFIAPTDAYPSQKKDINTSSLKHLKALYSNVKAI